MATLARTSLLGMLFAACLHAAPVGAFTDLAWVSQTGEDFNNQTCFFNNPCRTFEHAQHRVSSAGTIMCRDSGDFSGSNGLFVVIKSLTIDCTGHAARIDNITMFGLGETGEIIAGAEDIVVVLRGLTITRDGRNPIHFTKGRALHIENCTIAGFSGDHDHIAVRFSPEGESRLFVTDSVIRLTGSASGDHEKAGGGIVVKPTGSGGARVVLTRVQMLQNSFGIVANSTATTRGISMTISDSVSGGNLQDGILAISKAGQGSIRLTLERTRVLNNDANGIRSSGPDVVVRVNNSVVTGNAKALAFDAGGTLLSAGNNLVEGNANNSPFSGVVKLK